MNAVPDIMNNQVQVISIAPTLAANEVEQLITSPIEVAVANIPDVIELRSISRLGLSVVTIVFKDKTDIYWARQQISERLGEAEDKIPPGITKPELAPVSSGLGEIYQYVLHVKHGYEKKYNAMELRTIQDWIVRRELLGTPGVADVNSYGGFLKQYEISVDPEKLRGMGITLSQIFEALEKNNENTGSAYIDKKPNALFYPRARTGQFGKRYCTYLCNPKPLPDCRFISTMWLPFSSVLLLVTALLLLILPERASAA